MWQRPLVIERLAEVAHIKPAAAQPTGARTSVATLSCQQLFDPLV
jgi:hypothetical protein